MKKVLTFGNFDLLHLGHIELLEDAKKLGGYLVVGIFNDRVAAQYKRTPIIKARQRVAMLKALKVVDQVFIMDSLDPTKLAHEHDIDIIAKGPGANWEHNYKKLQKELGINCKLLKYHPINSTSDIIKKIKQS